MKKNRIRLVVLACLLFGLSFIAFGKESDGMSNSERRTLAQFPNLSWETVKSGKFMEEFEDYTTDQFPFREAFRKGKAEAVYHLFRQKDHHGIYLEEGHLSKIMYPLSEPMLEHATDRFQYIYDRYLKKDDAKVYLSIVPDKNYFLAKRKGYLAIDYEELFQSVREKTAYMEYIDITEALALEDYYYTDTHWRQERLLDVSEILLEGLGRSGKDSYEEVVLDSPFYGVYCGQAAISVEPDRIHYLLSEEIRSLVVTCYDGEEPVLIPVYDEKKGVGRDPYEMFLSGARAILTIENPLAEEEKELLVFRDSFGSSLLPLLAAGYSKMTVVDLRYVSADQLGERIEWKGQDTLFLYSTLLLNDSLAMK